MKKLINKIKGLFKSNNPNTDVNYIYGKLDEIAVKYGTRCSYLSIGKIYYNHTEENAILVSIQTLKRSCENFSFKDEIDIDKLLAAFELMLIKDYGSIKNM